MCAVDASNLYVPAEGLPLLDKTVCLSGGGGAAVSVGTGRSQKPRSPPPDLPSMMLNARIVYLGMPLVPAVTELIITELLYLQYEDRTKPVYLYINSTGTTRADGETVGFETEGTAIYDTMQYLKNDVRPTSIMSGLVLDGLLRSFVTTVSHETVLVLIHLIGVDNEHQM
jgi:hypothetical protein